MLTSTLSKILKYDIQLMYMYIIQLSYFIDIKRDRILNHEHMVLVQYTTLSKIGNIFFTLEHASLLNEEEILKH